jgi:predicted O-methyltransferase YrrM
MTEPLSYHQIQDYLATLVPSRPAEFQRMEAYAQEHQFPAISPAAGQFCYLLARLISARNIFELGSGYGYSTAWFARAVQENGGGVVHHTVWDDQLSQMARQHLEALGYGPLVKYHVAEAVQTLRQTPGPFDLIFNDIDKTAYPDSLPVIAEKLGPNGILIIDNMLSRGRILDTTNTAPNVSGVREFTRLITTDPSWVVSLVPIGDGLIVGQKKA